MIPCSDTDLYFGISQPTEAATSGVTCTVTSQLSLVTNILLSDSDMSEVKWTGVCWLGHLTCKNLLRTTKRLSVKTVPKILYNVSSGTLNSTVSLAAFCTAGKPGHTGVGFMCLFCMLFLTTFRCVCLADLLCNVATIPLLSYCMHLSVICL